jgi:alpha-1,2-mannosyltransferase
MSLLCLYHKPKHGVLIWISHLQPPHPPAAKLLGFSMLRAALGLVSAATEAWLYRAVAARYRPALAHCLLLFLCASSGLFAASTAMLPSSFTMYALTAASAGMMEGRPYFVILAAAIGVVWGWCVAGFAFLPYALWVLTAAPLLCSVGWLLLCLLGTLGPLVLVDRHFYGAWTVRAAWQSGCC